MLPLLLGELTAVEEFLIEQFKEWCKRKGYKVDQEKLKKLIYRLFHEGVEDPFLEVEEYLKSMGVEEEEERVVAHRWFLALLCVSKVKRAFIKQALLGTLSPLL